MHAAKAAENSLVICYPLVVVSKMDIPFNKLSLVGEERKYLARAITEGHLSGDNAFTRRCHKWFETKMGCPSALLTTSCTHALDMSAMLACINPGDEVIMPSYAFTSTANAFVLRGAKIVFIDIRPDTMNIDERLIEGALTRKTKAVVALHYAGVPCEMDVICSLSSRRGFRVIEDAAQALLSRYKGRFAGTIGHFGAFSFHETKNITCGEGGALLVNDADCYPRAEILREKGTDRSRFFRGEIDKYSWVDIGSSFLPGELNAAFLYAQLMKAEKINARRTAIWNLYRGLLEPLAAEGLVELPCIPPDCEHNGHIFYIKARDGRERTAIIRHLADKGIMAVPHYVPLHSSAAGRRFGRLCGRDRFTTSESERLLRLPLYYSLSARDVRRIAGEIFKFYWK